MPDISQLLSASHVAMANEGKRAEDQFSGSALLTFLKKKGGVKVVPWGTTLQLTLDYRRNPGAEFIATDLSGTSLAKTEVLTTAEYSEGQIVVPITWTFADEAKNPSMNQKVNLVTSLLENADTSHDDLIEEALFGSTTNGFIGLQTLLPDNGQGSPGGINATTDTWWRHYTANYFDDGSDIQSALGLAMSTAGKSSGGAQPDLIVSGPTPYNLYEGSLQPLVRISEVETGKMGFKALKFRDADVIFSQYGDEDRFAGIRCKNTKLYMAKGFARKMGDEIEITNQTAKTKKLYTMLQFATNNKSRSFVLTETTAP